MVYDLRTETRVPSFEEPGPGFVRLDAEALLLSAERIRQILARDLRLPARGGGRIHCYIYAPPRRGANVALVSTLYADGWQYRLEIPDEVERIQVVRGVVQALLLELANRGTAGKSAELPTWLIEGLAGRALATVGPDLVTESVPANALRRTAREIKGVDPLREIREFFRVNTPITFTALSAGVTPAVPPEELKVYQMSAELFVGELLGLDNSPAGLVRMVRELPNCWNWQTAFMRAFSFPRLLDVEKWWSVSVAALRPPGVIEDQSAAVFLNRLDDVLTVPAQRILATNTLPARADTTLASMISDWEFAQQKPVLAQKLAQLFVLRNNAPREVMGFIEGYRVCLHQYFLRRDQAGSDSPTKRQPVTPVALVVQETLRQLAELDRRKQAFQNALSVENSRVAAAPGP